MRETRERAHKDEARKSIAGRHVTLLRTLHQAVELVRTVHSKTPRARKQSGLQLRRRCAVPPVPFLTPYYSDLSCHIAETEI